MPAQDTPLAQVTLDDATKAEPAKAESRSTLVWTGHTGHHVCSYFESKNARVENVIKSLAGEQIA